MWRDNLHTLCSVWVYMFTVVIDKWDSGETAFVHCVQCGFIFLRLL